jgi:hypothetical protein
MCAPCETVRHPSHNVLAAGGEEFRERRQMLSATCATLLVVTTVFTLWAGFEVLDGVLERWRGLFSIGLAVAQLAIAAYFLRRDGERHPFGRSEAAPNRGSRQPRKPSVPRAAAAASYRAARSRAAIGRGPGGTPASAPVDGPVHNPACNPASPPVVETLPPSTRVSGRVSHRVSRPVSPPVADRVAPPRRPACTQGIDTPSVGTGGLSTNFEDRCEPIPNRSTSGHADC